MPIGTNNCGDCEVPEGALHDQYCWQERCTFCGGQAASCGCVYEKLEIAERRDPTEEEWAKFAVIIEKYGGRRPFMIWPNYCRMCGILWPGMFSVSDEVWVHYVDPLARQYMVCISCFGSLVEKIDAHSKSFDGEIAVKPILFTGEVSGFSIPKSIDRHNKKLEVVAAEV